MGSVSSRERSPYLWIKYHQHGRPVRESTGTKNETVARRMLRAREGDVERGIPIDPKIGRVTFHEAAEDMLNDCKANRQTHRCRRAHEAILANLVARRPNDNAPARGRLMISGSSGSLKAVGSRKPS